ncbi:MAG: hypothetical protein JO165_05770 [Candidatus Eremiobacteraeota bacterium]|nr:hypothetical protein [Candidatus Eremiobacteraeota bacterium]
MISFRTLALAVLTMTAVAVTAAPAPADPPPWAQNQDQSDRGKGRGDQEDGGRAQSRGVISGEIIGVDYSTGALLLQSGGRRFEVTVLPSTNIFQGRRGYATLADLSRGRRVDVYVSESGGRLFAQIIRIH